MAGLKSYWRFIVAIIIPLLLLPLTLVFQTNINAGRCGFVMILMSIYWVLELVPLPITGLLPAILFPLLGVQKAKEVCTNYFQDSVMLFVGGLLVALAVEETNLHKRVALRVLLLVGAKPHWIMAGFMTISAGLSMFISNTATTAMILPISIAVITELNRQKLTIQESRSAIEMSPIGLKSCDSDDECRVTREDKNFRGLFPDSSAANIAEVRSKAEATPEFQPEINFKNLSPRQQEISKAIVLSVAYASSIGGMATLTGTLTNVVFIGQFETTFPKSKDVTYATFSFFAFPTMLVCLVVAWCWLTFQFFLLPYFRTRVSETDPEMESDLKKMFRVKYNELGPMRFGEASALGLFIFLVLLWFFRAPGFMLGWDSGFRDDFISDATPAILIAFVLFLWPKRPPGFEEFDSNGRPLPYEPILNWKIVSRKFPWDVVLLLGGALALAEGVQVSGLTDILGVELKNLGKFLPEAALASMIALIVTFCTEFASNAAIASIFLPVVAELASSTGVHPLYYMLPVTISCSFAFMFPVATPPNAIVFSCGFLKVIDMIKAGVVLNFVCMALMIGSLHTLGFWVFDLGNFPDWAKEDLKKNITAGNFNSSILCNVTQGAGLF